MEKIPGKRPILWYADEISSSSKKVFADAARKMAGRVYDDARRMCPVGEFERSAGGARKPKFWKSWKDRTPGKLRDSISIARSRLYPTSWIVFVPAQGSDTYYSRWVELGAPKRSHQQWRSIGHSHPVPRQPFLRPALEMNEAAFEKELKIAWRSQRKMRIFRDLWSVKR